MPAATSATSSSGERSPPPFLQSTSRCVQSLTANILCHLPFSAIVNGRAANPTKVTPPPLPSALTVTIPLPAYSMSSSSSFHSLSRGQNKASSSSAIRSFSTGVRVDGIGVAGKGGSGGGPAFVGQVFSMLDSSGNGLMSVTTHFDIPFISKRVPEWIKKMLARVTKSEEHGPVFRFFMDLSDAVTYVKRVNVPTGVVGACRLDVAYEHFKAKPHMFEFVPNKEQVKAANKLLRTLPKKGGRRKVHGVPVFTADNLTIAIATADGIKWYAPYFFDKKLLDNIFEASIDQHFHTLIHNRRMQRRRNIADDGLTAEVEENIDSLFEPPEVQELLDEMGHPGVPLSVISKAAEVQLLDVVDKVLLGNKWLRKATGIQPKLPYLVDSFEERSAACFQKTCGLSNSPSNQQSFQHTDSRRSPFLSDSVPTETAPQNGALATSKTNLRFPFGDWFLNPWLKPHGNQQSPDNHKTAHSDESDETNEVPPNPLLPKITMIGVSMGEGSQMSRATLKKTMEELSKELEQASQASGPSSNNKDPLFVANVGDYSSVTRVNLQKS